MPTLSAILRRKPLVVLCLALSVGGSPALAKKKADPYAAWRNDPHSGAYLNRDAVKRAMAAGLVDRKHRKPPRIQLPAVNDPTADTTAQDTQSETTVLDMNGGNLIAGFNDSGSDLGGSNHFTGYAWSSNSGITWNDAGTLPASTRGDAGDPVLAFDKTTGAVYFGTLAFTGSPLPIQVFKSIDQGHTFAPAVDAAASGTSTDADKDWLAVDNFAGTGQHNLYVCYTEFGVSPAAVSVTRSVDGAATFSTPAVVSNTGQSQGCFLTVSPNHQVNVFYFRGTGSSNDLYTKHSTDGGVTFGPEILVAHLHTTSVNGDVALAGGARTNSFPHATAVPAAAKPFQYVIYNDLDPSAPGSKSDIYLVRSIDGGTTWSAPQRVNDDASGDQFMPTLAATPTSKLMIGYYSRSHDSFNLQFHRRGRLGSINADGTVTFNPHSFQLGPDNPIVIGQDPVINSVYMGDYDQIGATGAFSSVWGDNRSGDAFHANQPDVHYAQILASQPTADLSITVTPSPATINLGENTTLTVTASATGGTANDVYLAFSPIGGLAIKSVNSPGGGCETPTGPFTGCSLGPIAAGTSKSLQVVATGVYAAGSRTFTVQGTTSSIDNNNANNTGSATVTVNNGSAVATSYSTGNIAVAIPDCCGTSVTVPVAVPDQGTDVRVRALVRLNHTFDSDLQLTLISPTGKSTLLSNRRGGSGDNYGSGNNDCTGTFTTFDDVASTPISAGTAPFAGVFLPEQPLYPLFADPMDGTWKLRIQDLAGGDIGTVGCVKLSITHTQ